MVQQSPLLGSVKMVRDTIPPPKYETSFRVFTQNGEKFISHICARQFEKFKHVVVPLGFSGTCSQCGKSYSFEALRGMLKE